MHRTAALVLLRRKAGDEHVRKIRQYFFIRRSHQRFLEKLQKTRPRPLRLIFSWYGMLMERPTHHHTLASRRGVV